MTLGTTQTFKVGRMLQVLAEIGEDIPDNEPKTVFHCIEQPPFSILVFFLQLSFNAGIQDEQAILTLILIERLCSVNRLLKKPVPVSSRTMYR